MTLREALKTILKKDKCATFTSVNTYQKKLLEYYADNALLAIETKLGDQCTAKVKISELSINVTSTLKIIMQWVKKGTAVKIGNYAGVLLSDPKSFCVYSNGVVKVRTKSDDIVYMQEGVTNMRSSMRLIEKVNVLAFETSKFAPDKSYTELAFPKVSIEEAVVDMEPIIGLACAGFFVTGASQTVSLSMDEVGAKVKVAVRMTMTKSAPKAPKRFTVKGPFTMWMEKKDCYDEPYFVANITKDHLVNY
jgi:hypothetical protein